MFKRVIFKEFSTVQDRAELFDSVADEKVLDEIIKASNLVVTAVKDKKLDSEKLENRFKSIKDNSDRDKKIYAAYHQGCSQQAIANCLNLPPPYLIAL